MIRDVPTPAGFHRFAHEAMACTFEIATDHEDREYARQAAAAAFAEVDRLEQELSRFVEHSDVSRINALSAGEWTMVGAAALECLSLARQVHADTTGAFDVTVGGILRETSKSHVPLPGMERLQISREHRAVGLTSGRISVDLGAIGKGYAVDTAAEVLKDWSIERAIVHSGQSTALAIGSGDAASWPLAIRDPENHDATLFRIALTGGLALSGSGIKLHGSHIIDPRTGERVTARCGAWAIAPSAAWSDAISTAFMVMSFNEIESYCSGHPQVSGLTAERSGAGLCIGPFGAWPSQSTTSE